VRGRYNNHDYQASTSYSHCHCQAKWRGKINSRPSLLKGTIHVTAFVSADLIIQGLSAFKLPSKEFTINKVTERVCFGYCYQPKRIVEINLILFWFAWKTISSIRCIPLKL